MLSLEEEMPTVHSGFLNGHFSVQMGKRSIFGQNEADKTIENTINKDCKSGGDCIVFSHNFGASQRWVLNAARRGVYRKLVSNGNALIYKELVPARIKHDIDDVDKVVNLDNVFYNPFKELGGLTSLSAGIEATDLLEAKHKGKAACIEFVQRRFGSEAKLSFFDPMKKLK